MQELEQALIKADAAGNADDARVFAGEIRRMRAEAATTQQMGNPGYGGESPKARREIKQVNLQRDETSQLGAAAAGVSHGVGQVAMGAQHYVGKGVEALGNLFAPERTMASLVTGKAPQNMAQKAGQWLVDDAAQRRKNMAAEARPYKEDHPMTTGAGELAGNVAATWPVGGLLGKGVQAAGNAMKVGKFVAPVAESIATGGMRVGSLAGASGKAATAASISARAAGGAVNGGATAGLVDPESAGTGAWIGAALPVGVRAATTAGPWAVRTARSAFAPPASAAAKTVLDAAGAKTPAQIADLRAALATPRPNLLGEELTVPQILQTPGLSQLQRTLHNAGDTTLSMRSTAQNAQRLEALNRVSPVTGTAQEAALRFGNELEDFARPANDRAREAVTRAYESVDPHGVTALRLPVGQMRGAREQFLGRGTFGTGRRANEAIETAEELTTVRGADPMTGVPTTVERLPPFREIQNLRSSIGEAAAAAQANGANKEFAALSRMINAIDQRLDDVAAGRGAADELFPADVVDQWRRGNDMHAARLQRYETGPQRAMWRQGGDGLPVAQGGELAPKFFNASNGQAGAIAAFQRLRGRDFSDRSLKNYAITRLASQTDQSGNLLPSKVGNWMDAHSGAIPGLFSEGEQATMAAVRKSLDRAALAESLGLAKGSNTAQNAQAALNLGLLDRGATKLVAGRIPFGTAALETLRNNARQAKVRELGELLSDPQALNEAIGELLSRQGGAGLLSAPERSGGLLGLSVRTAPLLSTSP
jgi:hypothetical protein